MSEPSEAAKKKVPIWVWILGGFFLLAGLGSLAGGGDETDVPASENVEAAETSEDAPAESEPEEQEQAEEEQEREAFPDVSYSGSGDSILELELPAGPDSIGIASITHSGSRNFSIWALDENLDQDDLLVNEIGNYAGTVVFNLTSGVRIVAFEIGADGPWTVTLKDVLSLEEITQGSSATGQGDGVLLYRGETTIANVSHEGERNFALWSYGQDSDLLINEIGGYSGQVRWQSGPALIEITADGPWTIELQ